MIKEECLLQVYNDSFNYNTDNRKSKMEVKQSSSTILTRWYPESRYIKETAGGTTNEYTFTGVDTSFC